MIKSAVILIFIFLSGCSHTSKKERISEKLAPPDQKWIQELPRLSNQKIDYSVNIPSTTSDSQTWWLTYKRALAFEKTEPQKSCDDFLTLSQKKDFPLWDLAYVRSQLVCTNAEITFDANPILKNPWYLPLQIMIREKQTRLSNDLHDDIELLIEKSKRETQAKKKENFILEALNLAKKNGDQKLISLVEDRLIQVFPKYHKNPPLTLWLDVAQDFRQFRKFEQAEKFYNAVLRKGDLESKWSAWKGLRQIQKTKQDRAATLTIDKRIQSWLKNILKKNKNSLWVKRWHDHSLMQIRQQWTEDQYQLALVNLKKSAEVFKNKHPLDEIFFLLSRMQEEKGLFDEAQSSLNLALSEKESSPGLKEKILWASAWLYYKQNNFNRTIEQLNENLSLQIEPTSRYKYLFWKARAQKKLSLTESTETYKTLMQEDPLGIYGLLAYHDLNIPLPSLKSEPKNNFDLHTRDIPEIAAITGLKLDWLISLEETDILEESLKHTMENLKNTKNISEDSWLRFFSAFAQARLYIPLFSNLNKIKSETRDRLLKSHPELIFGRPYDEFVIPAAEKTGISPWFIYSIMRQESAFDPHARSPVDAMGLLQLMPELAKSLAQKSGIEFHQAEDLFEPKIGVMLGALELKNLLSRYKGNYILAVASYNASAKAIQGWLKSRMRNDPIEFLEEIPYEETRAYVKLVFRNFVFYERLNTGEREIEFPKNILNWPP